MAISAGATFQSFEAFQKALALFEQKKFFNFVVASSVKLCVNTAQNITIEDVTTFKYKRLYLKCKYSGEHHKKSETNERKTFTYEDNCEASIHVHYKTKKGVMEVIHVSDDHNHDRSQTIFQGLPKQRRLSGETKLFVESIVQMKPNMRLLQAEVKEKTGQTILLKDLHNVKQKISLRETNDLEAIFDEIKIQKYVSVDFFVSEEQNQLEGIYFQDARMKNYFQLYPEVVLMDATYKLNDRRMPLFLMMVIDGNGESQIVAMFMIRTENYDIVLKMLNKFKTVNEKHKEINTILSDKNFADRRAYKEAFPNAQLQLCIFHVLQNFNRELRTKSMSINYEMKKRVYGIMQRMVYAATEEQYMEAYEELKALKLQKVQEYFDKNWHKIETRSQWAAYFTNSHQNFLTRTTNRLESINQKLKTVVTKYGTLHNFFKETIQCIQSMSTERDQRTIRSIHRKPTDVTKETEDEKLYRNVLTSFALTKLLAEKMKMADVAHVGEFDDKQIHKSHANTKQVCSVDLAAKTCTCAFFKMMALPCRHLLRCLLDNEKNLFDVNMCHRRWFKRYLPSELIGDIAYIENETAMTQTAKFREANELLTSLADSLSEKSTAIFRTYMIELKKLLEKI